MSRWSRSMSWGPFFLASVLGIANVPAGWTYASSYRQRHADVAFDIQSGLPLSLLAEKHFGHPFGLYSPSGEVLYRRLEAMRKSGLGLISAATPSPETRLLHADDPRLSFDPGSGRLIIPESTLVHGMVWRWSIANRVRDRRVAVGFFRLNEDVKPVRGNVFNVPEVPVRNAMDLGMPLVGIQFQSVDPSASVLISHWSLLIVDGWQINSRVGQ
ncbi:hypothetical protein [Neorhodopirellula pilleata]|uniref:Uncharacterized protein n=1 Tax=Neorhodopirellula pilleata TaxID=2714738 RepID=A0A5C5ZGA5_9BACT|nr:hypothetical protein [Neorhodopirellula pilleata]TWT86087.1 hypothetical protein Pla100_62120 [Neorhodopirellula pilleata]